MIKSQSHCRDLNMGEQCNNVLLWLFVKLPPGKAEDRCVLVWARVHSLLHEGMLSCSLTEEEVIGGFRSFRCGATRNINIHDLHFKPKSHKRTAQQSCIQTHTNPPASQVCRIRERWVTPPAIRGQKESEWSAWASKDKCKCVCVFFLDTIGVLSCLIHYLMQIWYHSALKWQ